MSSATLYWSSPSKPAVNRSSPVIASRTTSVHKKQSKSAHGSARTNVWNLGMVLVLSFMFLSYVFLINNAAGKGFEMKKLQAAITEQEEVQKKLMVEQSLLNSAMNVTGQEEHQGMVPVTSFERLNINQFSSR